MQPLFGNSLANKARSFSLSGNMHLQTVCTEQMSLNEVFKALVSDFELQMKHRLEILAEEAQEQLVDPFKLDSDNMQKANNFEINLPARMMFNVTPNNGELRVLGGLLALNDYQVIGEQPEEAARRIFSSTGLRALNDGELFKTGEPLKDPR